MRRKIFIISAVLLLPIVLFAALTNDSSKVLSNIPQCLSTSSEYNPLYLMLKEVEDLLEGSSSGVSLSSPTLTTPAMTVTTEVTDANDVLTASQSGSYFFYTGGQDVNLPAATGAGTIFYIVDANAAAASDLTVYPDGTDTINGDAGGEYIRCTTDADGTMATLLDVGTGTWQAIYTQTAWTEE